MTDLTPSPPSTLSTTIDRILVCLVLSTMFWRCVQGADPMPYWSGDPFMVANPPVTILPTTSLLLSFVAFFAGLALLAKASLRSTWSIIAFPLCAFGLIAISNSIDGLLLSVDYAGAIVGAAGVASALHLEARRAATSSTLAAHPLLRLTLAMLVACVLASLTRGLSQYFFEHARTLASFRADKQAFFASQGWTEQSPMALAFDRRISQREASGWFGLANVFATLMAVSTVLLASLALLARRDRQPWRAWAALASCAATGVVLAGSKAGYAIVLIGVGSLALALLLARLKPALAAALAARPLRTGGIALILACAAVWSGLAVRAHLGEQLGERSLLFRAQYHQAALAIATNLGQPIDIAAREELPVSAPNPRVLPGSLMRGIGPENFKDRAMLVKPPTLPEDVASPHSLPIDLALGRGVPGLLMLALWATLAAACIGGLFSLASAPRAQSRESNTDTDREPQARDPLWLLPVLCCVVPTAFASLAEAPIATLENRGVRLLACLAACAGAIFTLHALRHLRAAHVRPALGAASLACCVHLLLELTGVTPGANAWCAVLLACGAALLPVSPLEPAKLRTLRAVLALVLVAVVGLLAWSSALHYSRVSLWQANLRVAFEQAEPIQQLRMRAQALQQGNPFDADTPDLLARETTAALGAPVGAHPRAILSAIDALQVRALPDVLKSLEKAQLAQPNHLPTVQALTKVQTLWADAQRTFTSGSQAEGEAAAQTTAQAAIDTMTEFARRADTASAWSWLAQLHRTHAALRFGDQPTHRSLAFAALEQAALLSPYELQHPRQLVALAQEQGDATKASAWAKRALVVHDLLRLDPLKQLPEAARREMQSIAEK